MELYFILFLTVFIGAIIQGITGFAFGMFVLMVLAYLFPYTQALAMACLMSVFILFYNWYLYRQYVNWKLAPLAMLIFAITDLFSVQLLKSIGNYTFIYPLLGVIFILMAIYTLWGQNKISIKPTLKNNILFNGIAGFLNGLFGAGGPFAAAYFLAVTRNKNEYISTMQAIFSVTMLIDVLIRAANGMFTTTTFFYSAISIWCMILGLIVGKKLYKRLNALTIKRLVCIMMILNGFNLILNH